MANITLKINSILAGWSPAQYFSQETAYNSSIGVDPDFPISSSDIRTSGFVVPIGYSKFSGVNVNASVVNTITNPKDTNTYVVLSNGKLISYNSALGSETLIGTVAGSNASGAEYYNNYIYIFGTGVSKDDVSRYGPLNNTPTLVDNVWKGATLGTQTALTNTTYPTIRSVTIPNHHPHYHPGDNSLYFPDFINGQGQIHKIKTKKVTNEGDTNNGSAYGVLSLPFGYYPVAMDSYNINDLVIVGFQTTDTTVNQGSGFMIFWDSTNTSGFYRNIPLTDPLATAILNVNGKLTLWSGNAVNGCRVSTYYYGDTLNEVVYQEEGVPPLPAAVASRGNRVVWGNYTTYPAISASVFALDSKNLRLSNQPVPLHNVVKTTSAGTNPMVTAVKFAQQSSNIQPKVIVASTDGSGTQIDSFSSSATLGSKMRWLFNIGKKFRILKIRMPLAGAVDATTSITPTLYFDDASTTFSSLNVINNTNYPGKRKVIYKTPALDGAMGDNNFIFELNWSNTTPLPVALPIQFDLEIYDDEPDSF